MAGLAAAEVSARVQEQVEGAIRSPRRRSPYCWVVSIVSSPQMVAFNDHVIHRIHYLLSHPFGMADKNPTDFMTIVVYCQYPALEHHFIFTPISTIPLFLFAMTPPERTSGLLVLMLMAGKDRLCIALGFPRT